MTCKYPMKLRPYTRTTLWAGRRLFNNGYGKTMDDGCENIAESWELTVRERERCMIENGTHRGETLNDYLAGRAENFPLLVKFLDAGDKLSIQVHPNKTEMWHVLECDDGAELIYGMREGVDVDELRRADERGELLTVMKRVRIHAGETYFIPSGLVHAIGAGILVAEIQQNSDTTYRVYDYDRRQPDGSLRELHREAAYGCIRPFSDAEISALRFSADNDRVRRVKTSEYESELLADCECFTVYRLGLHGSYSHTLKRRGADGFAQVMITSGSGEFDDGTRFKKGDSFYLERGFTLIGEASVIISEA